MSVGDYDPSKMPGVTTTTGSARPGGENWESDRGFKRYRVKSAEFHRSAPAFEGGPGWTLELVDGGSIGLTAEQCTVHPQPGEEALLFGRGFGYPVRGIVISGRVYRYHPGESAESEIARLRSEIRRCEARISELESGRP